MTLSLLWLIPAVGGLLVSVLPKQSARILAIAIATLTLVLAGYMAVAFDPAAHGYQFEENLSWIPQFHVAYHLGVDGISVWLVVLNALIGLVAVIAAATWSRAGAAFTGLLLVMEAGMAGLFLSIDLVLFYVFFEAMLIPAYFLLWLWGEDEKPLASALRFVIYTLVGSLLMLAGIVGEYVVTGQRTFELPELIRLAPGRDLQTGLFALFAIAFLVKVPVFPFHGWLPSAYRSAPTPMLLLLAGVMGKTGAYGLLRVAQPLFPHPDFGIDLNVVVAILAVIGIAWGGLMALAQTDLKLLIAYSSLSHMGFIVLGIFSFNVYGQQGAVIQMVNHGVIVPALFLLVAWISQRTGTRDRSALRGLAPRMPVMAGVFLVVTLAAVGLPGLNSFVGEFMTLMGAWGFSPWLAVAGCSGLVLAPVYMLRMFQGMMHGRPAPAAGTTDISPLELGMVTPLLLLMLILGLVPIILTRAMTALGQPMPWGG